MPFYDVSRTLTVVEIARGIEAPDERAAVKIADTDEDIDWAQYSEYDRDADFKIIHTVE